MVRQIMDVFDVLMAGGWAYYVRIVSAPALGHEGRPRKSQPDLVGWITDHDSHVKGFAIEVKGERGVASEGQEQDLAKAARAGGINAVVWTKEEMYHAFEAADVKIPEACRRQADELERRRQERAAGGARRKRAKAGLER